MLTNNPTRAASSDSSMIVNAVHVATTLRYLLRPSRPAGFNVLSQFRAAALGMLSGAAPVDCIVRSARLVEVKSCLSATLSKSNLTSCIHA